MAKYDLRIKARALRGAGRSIGAICNELQVSKGTVSLWCRDIQLTEVQERRLHLNQIERSAAGRKKGVQANINKRLGNISASKEFALRKIRSLSRRDLLFVGVALYWAEGSKTDSTPGFVFVNSDPKMIEVMFAWLTIVMGVKKEDVKLQVAINELHRTRIDVVLEFWSNLLELPSGSFRKTQFIKVPNKKVYENHDTYYGVLRVYVAKSSFLKYKTLALIERIKQSNMPE